MILQNLALANWNNGVIMIAIFALVCVTLIGILINFMMSGKKEEDTEE
jgi:flagellar basal body-associated protein FliL